MDLIDQKQYRKINTIEDGFIYNGIYRNHDETFQSMQSLDDNTFLTLHNAWNNDIKDDDVYLVKRDRNFNQTGIMKITAGGHGGSMSAYYDGNKIMVVTTLGLDKPNYPAYIAEFEYREGTSVNYNDSSFKHLKDYPIGAKPQCAVISNDQKLIGALENNWSKYHVYNYNNLNNPIVEIGSNKIIIASKNIIQSYCIYNDMLFSSLGGPGSSDNDPRGVSILNAKTGEEIQKVSFDLGPNGINTGESQIEPEGISVRDDTLYIVFRAGDKPARLLLYSFPINKKDDNNDNQNHDDKPQPTKPLDTINLEMFSGDPNLFYKVNLDNYNIIMSFIKKWNGLSNSNTYLESISLQLDCTDYKTVNRTAFNQFIENANKLNDFLLSYINEYRITDYDYTFVPLNILEINFEKDDINKYWRNIQDGINFLINQTNTML